MPNVCQESKAAIKEILGENIAERGQEGVPIVKMDKQKQIFKCPSVKERKAQYKYIFCSGQICLWSASVKSVRGVPKTVM